MPSTTLMPSGRRIDMHNCMENRDRRYVPKVNRYALRILSLAKALEREREAPPGISVGSHTWFCRSSISLVTARRLRIIFSTLSLTPPSVFRCRDPLRDSGSGVVQKFRRFSVPQNSFRFRASDTTKPTVNTVVVVVAL